MSDLAREIAEVKRELIALKAGFAGDPKRFSAATITQQIFTLTVTKPLTITVTFPHQDFPQLYTNTHDNTTGTDYASNLFERKDFYQWRMGLAIAPDNYTFTCILLSEQSPTSFTIAQDP